MAVLRSEISRIDVAKWAVCARDFVSNRCANRDLDAFDCVQDKQTKLAIKNVETRYVVELGTWSEGVTLLEREEVRTETVIADLFKPTKRAGRIPNRQSPVLHELQLLGKRKGQL